MLTTEHTTDVRPDTPPIAGRRGMQTLIAATPFMAVGFLMADFKKEDGVAGNNIVRTTVC